MKADFSAALATAPRQPVVWPLSILPDWLPSLAPQQQPLSGFRQMVKEGWRIGVLRLLATLMLLPGAPWGWSSICAGVGLQGLQSYLLQGFNKPPEPSGSSCPCCPQPPCALGFPVSSCRCSRSGSVSNPPLLLTCKKGITGSLERNK